MAIVISNSGKIELIDKMLKDALSTDENLILKLFKNNVTLTEESVLDDFIEADFTNYVSKIISRNSWNTELTGGKAKATSSTLQWNCGATGNTIYGYYLIGQNSNTLLWAEKFDPPANLSNNDFINVTPVFTFDNED